MSWRWRKGWDWPEGGGAIPLKSGRIRSGIREQPGLDAVAAQAQAAKAGDVMERIASILFCLAAPCLALAEPPSFAWAELLDQGASLRLYRTDGSSAAAPRLEDQDSFEKASLARNSKYVGWLALYPDRGASYSQPLHLVVVDRSNRIHRFAGSFGMVFGWCFTPDSRAVVFKYAFPHGMTSDAVDMRRIEDGKLLRHFELDPVDTDPDASQEEVLQAKAPRWALCAVKSAREP